MEHFPYVNSLWPGEGYNYNEPPDFWLVEISGIPFGLYSEMLEGGGNPWRGMVYGMTNRLPWCGDPREIWKLWDDFGIRNARMIGYWEKACPVRSGRNDVLATAYVREGKTLVALASWANEPANCRLSIDWRALGLDPAKACLRAPAMTGFQPPALFRPAEKIPVYPGRGWLLVVEHAKGDVVAPAPRDAYENRPLLVEDRFDRAALGEPWKTSLSSQPKTALKLASQAIVCEAYANGCAFAERPLPPGSAIVQCVVAGRPQLRRHLGAGDRPGLAGQNPPREPPRPWALRHRRRRRPVVRRQERAHRIEPSAFSLGAADRVHRGLVGRRVLVSHPRRFPAGLPRRSYCRSPRQDERAGNLPGLYLAWSPQRQPHQALAGLRQKRRGRQTTVKLLVSGGGMDGYAVSRAADDGTSLFAG